MRNRWSWLHAACALALLSPPAISAAADLSKVLHITFQVAESGFDPVLTSDYYSGTVIESIFDPLLTYDYLARPAKLVPNTAESLPEKRTPSLPALPVRRMPGMHRQREMG